MNQTIIPLIEPYTEASVQDGLYDPHKREFLLKHVAAELTVRAAVALPEIKPIFTGSVHQYPSVKDLLGEGFENYPATKGTPENIEKANAFRAEHEDSIWTAIAEKFFPQDYCEFN